MSGSYEDILNNPINATPKAQVLPAGGQWLFRAQSGKYTPQSATQGAYFMFVLTPVGPGDDVDPDDLAELGDYDYTMNKVFHRIYTETAADWQSVRNFLKAFGVDESMSYNEAITRKNLGGKEAFATVSIRNFTDRNGEQREENTLSNFVAVE